MIDAAKSVFIAQTTLNMIRPVVEAYQKKHLDILQPVSRFTGEIITDIHLAYHMSDEDFLLWDMSLREERDLAGLTTSDPEACPLLIAEGMLSRAEDNLIECMAPITGLTVDKVLASGPECLQIRKELIELTLQLLVKYVHHKNGV